MQHEITHLRTPPCSEELNRPENASLKDIVGKLKKAKAAIDAGGTPRAFRSLMANLLPGTNAGPSICRADTAALGATQARLHPYIAASS